jgi:hypothetical protein
MPSLKRVASRLDRRQSTWSGGSRAPSGHPRYRDRIHPGRLDGGRHTSIASAGLSSRGWSKIFTVRTSSSLTFISLREPISGGLPLTPRSSFEVPSLRWTRKVKCFSTYFIEVLKEARQSREGNRASASFGGRLARPCSASRAGCLNVWAIACFQKGARIGLGSFTGLGRLRRLKPNTKKVEANNQERDDNPCHSKGEHVAHIMSRDA